MLEREEIYSRLWGYTMVRGDRSVDVFVRKLRQKLEKASPRWRYIHTHFGIGYRFAAESLEVVDPSAVPSSLPPDWDSGDQRKLAGAQRGPRARHARPLGARPPSPPFLRSMRRAGEAGDHAARGRARDRRAAARPVAGHLADRVERLRGVEAAGERRVARASRPRCSLAERLGGELGGLRGRAPWG